MALSQAASTLDPLRAGIDRRAQDPYTDADRCQGAYDAGPFSDGGPDGSCFPALLPLLTGLSRPVHQGENQRGHADPRGRKTCWRGLAPLAGLHAPASMQRIFPCFPFRRET